MPPGLRDIILSKLTYDLLFENGKSDCERGVSMYDGWRECATIGGFDNSRTPAQEAYEDGYYSTHPKKSE